MREEPRPAGERAEPRRDGSRPGVEVRLSEFEGPLDLLLHLVKKHELDLSQVSIAAITDRYLASVAQAQNAGGLDLDGAGEFLVMAATLVYLKSRALLPPEEREDATEEEEPFDPELRLVEQILELERFQRASAALGARPVLGRDVFARPVAERAPGHFAERPQPASAAELLLALERLFARRASAPAHEIATERLTILDGIEFALARLREEPRIRFDALFPEDASRTRIIVTFLALLELIRLGVLAAFQGEAYGAIDLELLRDVDPDELLALEEEDR